MLHFFSIVLPCPSKVPSSSYVLISKCIDYGKDAITQHYCGSCMSVLQPGLSCVNSCCSNKGGMQRGVFVRVSLAMQLKEHFAGDYNNFMNRPRSMQILANSFSIDFVTSENLGLFQIYAMEVCTQSIQVTLKVNITYPSL
jgi:hypothetical protein